jgi:hypothetical protein
VGLDQLRAGVWVVKNARGPRDGCPAVFTTHCAEQGPTKNSEYFGHNAHAAILAATDQG